MNHQISKAVLSCNNLVTLTYYVLELLELLLITHLLASIIWDSSLGRTSCVHTVYIQLKPEDISYTNIRGSTNTRTLKGILLLILHYFSNLTRMLFLLVRSLLIHTAFSITIFLWFSLISFLLFFFLFNFSFSFSMLFQSICI